MKNLKDIITELEIKDECAFLGQYYVPDHNIENCSVLFVVESPHSNEIIHKHPLAGDAGINLSKAMCGAARLLHKTFPLTEYKPFGCSLKDGRCNYYGILNVCNIPFQSQIYSCEYQKNLAGLNIIRKLFDSEKSFNANKDKDKVFYEEYEKIYIEIHNILDDNTIEQKKSNIINILKQKKLNKIFHYLIDNLCERSKVLSSDTKIIACGHIAQNLLKVAEIKYNHEIVHPISVSYGTIEQQKQKMSNLKLKLSEIEYVLEKI